MYFGLVWRHFGVRQTSITYWIEEGRAYVVNPKIGDDVAFRFARITNIAVI